MRNLLPCRRLDVAPGASQDHRDPSPRLGNDPDKMADSQEITPTKPVYHTDQEPWSWSRWLKSRFSGRRLAKSFGILLDIIVVAVIIAGVCLFFGWIRGVLTPPRPVVAPPAPDTITAQTAQIDKSQSDTHVTNINLPLAGLFGRQDNNTKQK